MLVSATFSQEIEYLAKKYTKDAVKISIRKQIEESKLPQVYYNTPKNLKFSLLVYLLKKEDANLVMVFCNTRRNVDFLTDNLRANGIHAKAIHGGMEQKKRTRTLEEFHSEGGVSVLICTDVASRGLDIKGVSHIYNYDLPAKKNEYTHRIGRTARAGKEGKVINILSSEDYQNFSAIIDTNVSTIVEKKLPKLDRIFIKKTESRPREGFSQGRGGRFSGRRGSQDSGRRGNSSSNNRRGQSSDRERSSSYGSRGRSSSSDSRGRSGSGRSGGFSSRGRSSGNAGGTQRKSYGGSKRPSRPRR